MLAQNYYLSISFVDGTSAESGVALRLRNQELMDSRRSDVERWRNIEKNLFEVEERILLIEEQRDAGFLLGVDYEESTEILSDQEQREKWDWEKANGLTDNAKILMEMDADKYPDRKTAQAYLDELAEPVGEGTEEGTSPLLAALTTPV